MAKGFATTKTKPTKKSIQVSDDYKTLFDIVKEKSGGAAKPFSWYRKTVKEASGNYKINDEPYDKDVKQDANEVRTITIENHLYMFEYKAKMKWLPYYDKFPLVYVLRSNRNEFWGVNLHYLSPKKRIIATKKLLQGRIDLPKACFHKYIHAHVENGVYIDLATVEWDTAILLPTEDFVKNINGSLFPIDKKTVWEDTDEVFYDKITGQIK
jgi:hypothetical protein